MQIQKYIFIIFWFVIPVMTAQCQQPINACRPFYDELMKLSGEDKELDYTTGMHKSVSDGKEYSGCEVKYVTSDSTVTNRFRAVTSWTDPDSEIYKKGWRINDRYTADGPGSMSFALEKGDMRCFVLDRMPASLEEPGKIVQSEILTVVVQCHDIGE